MKISKFKMDGEAEAAGIWEDVGEGLSVRVARVNNTKYREYLRKLGRPFMRQIRRNALDLDTLLDMTQRATAKFILLDWKGLEDENGGAIPFSEGKALELFKEFPDFYELVQEIATDAELFKQDSQEDSEGNLPVVSSGSSSGESTESS